MIHALSEKTVVLLKPQSVATSATATATMSRDGFDYLTIDVLLDSAGAVSSNPAVLKLAEGDGTSYTDITAGVGDGTGGFTIPDADTANPQVVRFCIDCRKRKKNLKITLTPAGAAQLVGALAILRRSRIAPLSDSQKGAAEIVYI